MTTYAIGLERDRGLKSNSLATKLKRFVDLKPDSIMSSGSLTQVETKDIGFVQAIILLILLKTISGVNKVGSNPAFLGLTKNWSPSLDL